MQSDQTEMNQTSKDLPTREEFNRLKDEFEYTLKRLKIIEKTSKNNLLSISEMEVEGNTKKWTTMGLSDGRKSAVALYSRFVEDKRNSRIDLYEDLVVQAVVDMIDMPETEWR
eukprot:712593_1